jgi:hypothetical protein
MADGDECREFLILPHMSKAEKTKVVDNIGMIIFDTDANKISIKCEAAALIGSWELVTSVDDA